MRGKNRSADEKLARIAGLQHGNVTRAQALAAGLSSSGIERRVAASRLHPEFRGVYRVGHRAPSVLARYAAAVLAGEAGAALSGRAAAHLLRIIRGLAPPPEITLPRCKSLPCVIVHRIQLDDDETCMIRGIRCTTVARTLVDLAGVLSLEALARVHHEARIRHQVYPAAIEAILATRPSTKGIRELRAVVHGDTPALLSRLERGFRAWLRANGFAMPVFNRKEGAHYVDCRWPLDRLIVELDSFRFHNDRKTWEDDRQRERDARARGDEFRRFTWHDVFEDQSYMLAELTNLLR